MHNRIKKSSRVINTPSDRERKFLTFSTGNSDKNEGVLGVKEIIDKTTNLLFTSYKTALLSEPLTYIISAVWGKTEHGTLSADQREIHANISVIINDIVDILEIDVINDTQRFAIEYLIRGLIISKVTYLVEVFRNRHKTGLESNNELMDLLNSLEVAGSA